MTTVEIFLNNGKTIRVDIEAYQSSILAESLNDNLILFVTIGDTVINRNTIQMITPIDEPII